jgi:hypothetical protein
VIFVIAALSALYVPLAALAARYGRRGPRSLLQQIGLLVDDLVPQQLEAEPAELPVPEAGARRQQLHLAAAS